MSTKKEKILQKINPKLLKMTPKLSVGAGSVINLDSDENCLEDGAKKLMMRFFINQDLSERFKKNTVQRDIEVTVSSAKYNDNEELYELVSERLTFPSLKNEDEFTSDKPGRKLQELKLELQNKMSAKWEAEYNKRISELKKNRNDRKGRDKENYSEERNDVLDDENGNEDDGDDDDDDDDDDEDVEDDEDNDNDNVNKSLAGSEKSLQALENEDDFLSKEAIEGNNTPNSGDENDAMFDGDDETDNSDSDSDDASANEVQDNPATSVNEDDKAHNNCVSEDDYDGCSLVPAYQPGGGLLYGGSELTQCKEDLPQYLLSPSLRLSITESPSSKSCSDSTPKTEKAFSIDRVFNVCGQRNKLFSDSQNSLDLNDAFDLCSGKFPEPGEIGNSQCGSFIEDLAACSEDDSNEKDQKTIKESCFSSTEENLEDSPKDLPKSKKRIIVLEESEPEDNCELMTNDDSNSAAATRLLELEDGTNAEEEIHPHYRKNRINLQFSDEEDETNDLETGNKSDGVKEESADSEDEELDKRSIHYDSEENEINPKEFFEREAELSGSEWSGDEDERGLDQFDVEDGDADNLDNDQVRSQLGKIHIRRVLDDDAREVRLIQELLFEDGDLHSNGKRRDRRFKWKNLGNFDEKKNDGEPVEENGNSSEEDCAEEEQRRKLRHEKDLFLMEMKKNGDASLDDEIVDADFQKLKVTTLKSSIRLSSTKENSIEIHKSVADYTEVHKPFALSRARGSFLTRNEEFLTRLAKVAGSTTDTIMGPKNSKNFIFAAVSPEKPNDDKSKVYKRQTEDLGNCGRREKKIKLLDSEGPSILDLLV